VLKNQGQNDKCYRDIGCHYLRLINYSLVVGGTVPIDEWALPALVGLPFALNLPNRAAMSKPSPTP